MRFRPALLVVVLASLLAFGCANPGYDTDATQDDLVRAGLTAEQARCVTRGLEGSIGSRRLDTNAVPDETEFQAALEVLADCNVDVSSDAAGSS